MSEELCHYPRAGDGTKLMLCSKVPCDTSADFSTKGEISGNNSFRYRKVIDSTVYIATNARLDIAFLTSIVARHVKGLSLKHQKSAPRVVKYPSRTSTYTLEFELGESAKVIAYVDANWSGKPGTRQRS